MHAVAFDIDIDKLKQCYGEDYHLAYADIRTQLDNMGFTWVFDSLYFSEEGADLTAVFNMITLLSNIDWFKQSVRDLRVFKVQDLSNFTQIVKS